MSDGDLVMDDVRILLGDARERLADLADGSAQCIVTSPPFWGLRDYGHGDQIGAEDSPGQWVDALVETLRGARRVLREDGVMWLEVGDTYNNRAVSRTSSHQGGLGFTNEGIETSWADHTKNGSTRMSIVDGDLKEKDLIGAPWMLAFALRADGWYLRSDTIWARPNPMPESVLDRPTKAHSYVFLLTKSARYYYDADAIREAHTGWVQLEDGTWKNLNGGPAIGNRAAVGRPDSPELSGNMAPGKEITPHPAGRNARSVWSIPTEATPFAHFATMPQALAERSIKAGTSEHGCCAECGAPWVRLVERADAPAEQTARQANLTKIQVERTGGTSSGGQASTTFGLSSAEMPRRETIGWAPSCTHDAAVVPCTVLDPFMGSGTTALVARRLGRHSLGVELNAEYVAIAADRLKQMSLL